MYYMQVNFTNTGTLKTQETNTIYLFLLLHYVMFLFITKKYRWQHRSASDDSDNP